LGKGYKNLYKKASPAKRVVDFRSGLGAFLGASDEPLHSLCSLQGLICDANPQGVAQPPLQSTNIQRIYFKKCHPQLLVMSHKKAEHISILCVNNLMFFK